MREIESCLAIYRIFVIPRDVRASHDKNWSIWKEADPSRYAGIIWRQNTGAAKMGTRFVRFGVPGLSDFTGWLYNRAQGLQIEVKGPNTPLTIDQASRHLLATSTGILSVVVRSFDDMALACESWGLKKL